FPTDVQALLPLFLWLRRRVLRFVQLLAPGQHDGALGIVQLVADQVLVDLCQLPVHVLHLNDDARDLGPAETLARLQSVQAGDEHVVRRDRDRVQQADLVDAFHQFRYVAEGPASRPHLDRMDRNADHGRRHAALPVPKNDGNASSSGRPYSTARVTRSRRRNRMCPVSISAYVFCATPSASAHCCWVSPCSARSSAILRASGSLCLLRERSNCPTPYRLNDWLPVTN